MFKMWINIQTQIVGSIKIAFNLNLRAMKETILPAMIVIPYVQCGIINN